MTTIRTHVILGGNGVVGRETARALLKRNHSVASVGRRPSILPGVRSIAADLLEPAAVAAALDGADVAYLTAGIPYSTREWTRQWPIVMRNAIDSALAHGTHLIFLDNVYAYGRVEGPMTEQTPIRPSAKKGQVRASLLEMLATAAATNGLRYTVARSADFFGPGATASVFNSFAIDKIVAGKAPTWLYNADLPHSLTYTPDIGEGLAVLGTAALPSGGVWHLPTSPALTGREYLRIASGADGPFTVMSMGTMRIGAIFLKDARESLELSYQNTEPYVFDSSAFEGEFGVAPTPIEVAIAETVSAARATAVPTS